MSKVTTNKTETILNDKTIKVKEKVSAISQLLLHGIISLQQLIEIAKKENDSNKATIIESIENATKSKADIITELGFVFVIENLKSEAPRVKWESAKVITNTVHLFPKKIKQAVGNLLKNVEHPGTVVRWSAAGALSKIIQCKTSINKELIPTIEAIVKREEDHAIRKIYQQGLRKAIK